MASSEVSKQLSSTRLLLALTMMLVFSLLLIQVEKNYIYVFLFLLKILTLLGLIQPLSLNSYQKVTVIVSSNI